MIEMMISVGILALISVTAFPFLQAYQTRLDLEDAALSLQNCLMSANDYARGPSGGATSYRATLTPAARTCVVERVGPTPATMEEYSFTGVDFANNIQTVQSFSLAFATDVLHAASYATTPSDLAALFGGGSVVWTLTPAGKTSPSRQVTINLTHGIVTISP